MKKIVLNWLPPADVKIPSPAHSVLKDYLENHGYEVEVKYWNLLLGEFIEGYINYVGDDEQVCLLPFYANIAIDREDERLLEYICYKILSLKPQFHSKGIGYLKNHLLEKNGQFIKLIDQVLSEMDLDSTLFMGFSSQFYQWIASYVITSRLRVSHPHLPVIVGGFGTSSESAALLRNFRIFDFSSWGEGEHSLLRFSEYVSQGEGELSSIPHLSYRDGGQVKSSRTKAVYVGLDEVSFDLSDYFIQSRGKESPVVLPFETGRGCHWNRCHFCFLNAGYRFRRKSLESVREEIERSIERYHVESVTFLDNDLVGNDMVYFDKLLDILISVRDIHNDFCVSNAEIITRGVSYELIKKMRLANFAAVQIGYESPSNELLKFIDKKSTFANNLFFIKWATQFGIYMNGMNIIKNLIEEESTHVKEGIKNLRYMRFYLSCGLFTHNMSVLAISKSSKYFKHVAALDPTLSDYESLFMELLPKGFVSAEDSIVLFNDFSRSTYNPLWDVFEQVEGFYRSNHFDYSLICIGTKVVYKETMNASAINEIEFDRNDIHWKILEACNKRIESIDSLSSMLLEGAFLESAPPLLSAISDLESEGLIYSTPGHDEIMTIINTDKIHR